MSIQKTKNKKEKNVVPQTQWNLILTYFCKHNLAVFSFWLLIIFYLIGVLFPEFIAPYGKMEKFDITYLPPQKIHFIDINGDIHWRPFVYSWEKEMNPENWEITYKPNNDEIYPLRFFVKGEKYKIMGLFETDWHFFGVEEGGTIFIFGTDKLGRDIFSRVIYGCRISLTVGLVGVLISMVLGLIIGGISGLFGGVIDDIIQRIIETLMAVPKIPLWMGLAAAIPHNWSTVQVYFAITVILSLMGWTGLARVVRSKFISLREEDFVKAAKSYNSTELTIIGRHLIPNFLSYVIVNLTLAIPRMIIAETSLSFLGIGLRPPVVSLGVLLNQAQSFQTVSMFPWLMFPGLMVVVVVLAFNFVGDGLRDAVDPYKV